MKDQIEELLKDRELVPDRRMRTNNSVVLQWNKPFIAMDCYDNGKIVLIYETGGKTYIHEFRKDCLGAVGLLAEKLNKLGR